MKNLLRFFAKSFGHPRRLALTASLTIPIAPAAVDYWIMTTTPRERVYRAWWLQQHRHQPLLEAYGELATRFPHGLTEMSSLQEEISGEVRKGASKL
jgi:hypothetical protein